MNRTQNMTAGVASLGLMLLLNSIVEASPVCRQVTASNGARTYVCDRAGTMRLQPGTQATINSRGSRTHVDAPSGHPTRPIVPVYPGDRITVTPRR